MVDQFARESDVKCPSGSSFYINDPSDPDTWSALETECMSRLLNTCKGGISHIEMDPFFLHRPEAHPGSRCSYVYPGQFGDDPNGAKCAGKSWGTDCTHVSSRQC